MSSPVVAVNIVRQPSPFAPQETRTRTKSYVRLEGSVADLRKALLEDHVIQPGDKFYSIVGKPVLNASEASTKWMDALQDILVVGEDITVPVTAPTCTCHVHTNANVTQTTAQPVHEIAIQQNAPLYHCPAPKAINQIPQGIYSSAESEASDTKTLEDIPVTRSLQETCNCCHQETVIPKITIVPDVPVLEVVNQPIQEIPQVKQDVIPKVEIAEVYPDTTVEMPACPCEACQALVIQAPAQAAVIETQPEVLVVQEVQPVIRDVSSLTDNEKELLITKSGLGYGINIDGISGPVNTRLPVLAHTSLASIQFADVISGLEETLITSSARDAAYVEAGWTESCLAVEHPWVLPQESSSTSVNERYLRSKCELALSSDIKPHPDFENAIQQALTIQNAAKRSEELGNVFRHFGHVYIVSLEVGGMKHMAHTGNLAAHESMDTPVDELKSSMTKMSVAPSLNGEREGLEITGGIANNTGNEWETSLADPANWAVTRITRVESVINLFDEVTRAKILAVVPQAVIEPEVPTMIVNKVPLHRLFCPRTGVHFYTIKAAEVDNAVRGFGYNYEALAAHILPEQVENTVPLYRVHRGNKHLYTINLQEQTKADAHGVGLVGYVYATQHTGTFPLYRIFNPRTDAYLFTTNINEKESLMTVGWNDEGVACYVYL